MEPVPDVGGVMFGHAFSRARREPQPFSPRSRSDQWHRAAIDKKISSYKIGRVRRRAGHLLVIEQDILEVGLALKAQGTASFHGFAAAKVIQKNSDGRRLTAQGTLYKALGRLERAGLLTSEWEDPELAVQEGRPRRRLYQVTDLGEQAMVLARADRPLPSTVTRRLAPG